MNWFPRRGLGLLGLAASFELTAGLGWAGPVLCTTSGELTSCAAVQTTPALVEQRFYTYTSPFASGVDLSHQVTDLLGIAMGGVEGNRLMGFGFPDQTIVWDGTVLQNTYQVLLEQQSNPLPWRTVDVGNGFAGSLASGGPSPKPVVDTPPVGGLAIW
ncbi:Occludin/ELL family protein [Cyanobium sp. HWJ4-Hawea]|uniref:Occludin/ELL family protein n=1 Tax=Cyanobium sp. HWJ4-Hawea TaxID=2823713 RepID=UPI0020CCC486|nr:Occludin/ELL family protein [Cyanobium sp. HWJ4-Hawea]